MKNKKEKKEKEIKINNPYRDKIYSLMKKEKANIAEEKLRKKEVLVGEGYNVEKLKKEYRKEKIKEFVGKNFERIGKKIESLSKQKVVSKRVLKPSQMTATIPNYKAPSVLGDPNRFFKNELEEVKKNLFFE